MEISFKTLDRIFQHQELEYLLLKIMDEQLENVFNDFEYGLYLQRLYEYISINICVI